MEIQKDSLFRNHWNQFVATVTANLIYLSFGTMIGGFATATPLLLSQGTPLKSGPLTNDQLSWIGSSLSIGAIASTLTFGFITKIVGCKKAILCLTIPSIIFYVLIFIGDSYVYFLWARFFAGICSGGMQTTMIIYVAEIANNKVRGKMAVISHVERNAGIFLAHILGAFLPYKTISCIFVFIPIVFAALFVNLPNTAQYHLRRDNFQKAEAALRFYKGLNGNKLSEFAAFNTEFENLKTMVCQQKDDAKLHLHDIFNRPALFGILNGSILASLAFLTGYMVFATYSVTIFRKTNTSIDPYILSIAFALLQLMGNLCTSTFVDSLGRKTLLIVSLLGSSLGMYSFSLYCYLTHIGHRSAAFEWIPITSLLAVIFTASCGVVPLMQLCMVEQLPYKFRTIGITICNVIMQLVSFTLLKLFPILMVSVGLHGSMLIFAIPCSIGALYVFFIIRETKGIPINA